MEPKEVYDLVENMRRELKKDFESLEEKSDKLYVKIEAFDPVRRLVYGLVSLTLTAVVLAIIGLVLVR